ncbi:MCM DNA helicase complex subunit [Ceratocystis pirilliformis]|uniref:DNA replication licensing factor MCM2 n=1 Tax=Ceratocystis pirilliformis TaxID=259994 RepID=A0ABR3ZNX5_9PEZI
MSSPPVPRDSPDLGPGPSRSSRKRSRSRDDHMSIGSSPALPSSPPMRGDVMRHGADDDDVIEDDQILDVDDIDDLDELAEGEVDLFNDNFMDDYRGQHSDDGYEGVGLDDTDYGAMNLGSRRALESEMNRRDRQVARNRNLPSAFLGSDFDNDDIDLTAQPRRHRNLYDEAPDDMGMDIMEEQLSSQALSDMKTNELADWIATPSAQRTIKHEFKRFMTESIDSSGNSHHATMMLELASRNAETITVSYELLSEHNASLAYMLCNAPSQVLKLFDEVAMDMFIDNFPDYANIQPEVHVRFKDLPINYTLRQLRQSHLNCLVSVTGVVTRRTGVFPQLKYVKFDCTKCGITLGPYQQESNVEVKVSFCMNCQSRGPFTLNTDQTIYRNYQKITLQESPGKVEAGRLPRHREVILLWDLIDTCKPGDEVEIVGIYRNSYDAQLNNRNGFPVFATVLEANNVIKENDDLQGFNITPEEEKIITALGKEPDIIDRIIDSIGPSIYGHRDIKTAVALSLFGGVAKTTKGSHHIRGDINVLLLGDPGTAKSQMLKFAEKTAQRAVFATGQGASAVGLTASVRRDPVTNEWTLEGGALVLADKGTCLIDEFDKMNDQDRTSIHEAMEQQTISISKAGIVTTLQARCGIIAGANPIGGRYNSTIPFSANVELTEPILSRFDILCVVRDVVDPEEDKRLASFITDSHEVSHPTWKDSANLLRNAIEVEREKCRAATLAYQQLVASGAATAHDAPPPGRSAELIAAEEELKAWGSRGKKKGGPIDQELLRKYITYARKKVRPVLYQLEVDKVSRLFADMRRESMITGAYPITVRHLEAILRITEAFCRMRLSDFCLQKDIDRAIEVTIESFIGSQKASCKRALSRTLSKYLVKRNNGSNKRGGAAPEANM